VTGGKALGLRRGVARLRDAAMVWRLRRIGPRPVVTTLPDRVVGGFRVIGVNSFQMGSATPGGQADPETFLHRRYAPRILHRHGSAWPDRPEPEQQIDTAIYGGLVFDQFGHFILESCAALWAAPRYPDLPILLGRNIDAAGSGFRTWQSDILDLLGVADRIVVLGATARVKRLLVPKPGYEIQYRFGPHHRRFLARVPWRPVKGRKIWVSRRGFDPREAPGRDALETALVAQGWTMFAPETASVADQIATYASAERIAGEQGSALHGLVFLSRCAGLRLDMFARDPEVSGHRVNANQETICRAKRIVLRTHRMDDETVISRHGPQVQKQYLPPGRYLERLATK